MHEDIVHLPADQERLKGEYNDPDVLLNVNKAIMAWLMEAIKEYLRPIGVIRASLT